MFKKLCLAAALLLTMLCVSGCVTNVQAPFGYYPDGVLQMSLELTADESTSLEGAKSYLITGEFLLIPTSGGAAVSIKNMEDQNDLIRISNPSEAVAGTSSPVLSVRYSGLQPYTTYEVDVSQL